MLKRLRWKFTLSAMLAVLIVLAALVAGINLVYRRITFDGVDRMLAVIADNGGQMPLYVPNAPGGGKGPWGFQMTPETPFETRFFVVWENDGGEIYQKQLDYIAAVTGEDADSFYERASATGKDAGLIGPYRFRRTAGENGDLFVFLDCSRQLRSMQNLLLVSSLVTFAALLGMFALVWLLSGKAIEPTVQGIERQKRFITDASHEIKTPLTVIRSYADVMCMEDEENEWARGIQKESERLSHLVSNLVLLSRWDEEAPITEKREFDLSRALWDTLTPYQNLAEAKGRELRADVADGLRVTGDESAVQTAFATLLENAVQYSLPDSSIEFTARREKRHAVARLSNRCALSEGFDPNRLFDRFYRSDHSRSRDTGGSGIGLSLAKAIIEAHGGEIGARMQGADTIVFDVRLPLCP
ncbi:MAG: GHKL domain-containing protein [Ruminococcaceae bacterium]|nr:GHKL domain-containing protein [Oscillospiraceae bacterium]